MSDFVGAEGQMGSGEDVPIAAIDALLAEGYDPDRIAAAVAEVNDVSYRPLSFERAMEVLHGMLGGPP
jgi:hypothetical protein